MDDKLKKQIAQMVQDAALLSWAYHCGNKLNYDTETAADEARKRMPAQIKAICAGLGIEVPELK